MNPAGRGPECNDPESEAAGDVIGFVLAGGQSSRMGRDKALLPFAGRPLVAHALSILEAAGVPAMIAGAASSALRSLPAFAPIVEDASPGLGPLSGICAALSTISSRYAVFLPVDLASASGLAPRLPSALTPESPDSAVTVPSVSGFAQTFPAVLDRAALPALQNELDAQRYGCFSAFQAASAAVGQSVSCIAVELLAQTGQVSDPLGCRRSLVSQSEYA